MHIGVPQEIKDHEYRVGLTPAGVSALVGRGHAVSIQARAGARIGFDDDAYRRAGARVVETAAEAYAAELVVKIKEPQPGEWEHLRAGQTLFGYLHLAADRALTEALLGRGVTGVAYETVTDAAGTMPLLTPMSEVAGRLATLAGAEALQMKNGGNGTLIAGVPGVAPARVVIVGGGTVGSHAARMAIGIGADVTVLDRSLPRLRQLEDVFGARLKTVFSEPATLEDLVTRADLVVGAVLLPGKRAPHLLSRALIRAMHAGSAFVDVAIDQGGVSETSRPTTHSDPFYVDEGVVHYCVTNMPAASARTATLALTQATLPYVLRLADAGVRAALTQDPGLLGGLNVHRGQLTQPGVAEDFGMPYRPAGEALR